MGQLDSGSNIFRFLTVGEFWTLSLAEQDLQPVCLPPTFHSHRDSGGLGHFGQISSTGLLAPAVVARIRGRSFKCAQLTMTAWLFGSMLWRLLPVSMFTFRRRQGVCD